MKKNVQSFKDDGAVGNLDVEVQASVPLMLVNMDATITVHYVSMNGAAFTPVGSIGQTCNLADHNECIELERHVHLAYAELGKRNTCRIGYRKGGGRLRTASVEFEPEQPRTWVTILPNSLNG